VKFLDEYRNRDAALALGSAIRKTATRPWALMEVCGGQTHSIVRYGIDQLLGERIELLHGPGCPVCVTPLRTIDRAHAIASHPGVTLCSFGDMLRVPGSRGDLFGIRAEGGDVRVVYSPLDAIRIAEENPDRQVIFFAIGFETTAPANAMAALVAMQKRLENFSLLVSHVLVPPVLTSILQSPGCRVSAFLGPGHVCTVMGTRQYEAIADHYSLPIVITGFEPLDHLEGVLRAVQMLEKGEHGAIVQYGRAVRPEGSLPSRKALRQVFEVCDREWRGIGTIPKSGYRLRHELSHLDAEARFDVADVETLEPRECISGQILRGVKKPADCPQFGNRCTPDTPLGATMVSAEGACAAYFAYRPRPARRLPLATPDTP
jgi:hydrogenase expression/formation protein HypD